MEIEYEENQLQNQPQKSLLHDLIHEGYYDKVYSLFGLINEDLTKRLTNFRIPWNEANYNQNDKILPFYLALSKQ